jgi:hypothetical protein
MIMQEVYDVGPLCTTFVLGNALARKFLLHVRKKDDSDDATGMKYGVASSSSCSKSICNPEMGITRIKGRPKITASFQR